MFTRIGTIDLLIAYTRPVDSLYSFISDTYFSDFQNNRCFIAQGLMVGVLPF